jgi:hypothetical protein
VTSVTQLLDVTAGRAPSSLADARPTPQRGCTLAAYAALKCFPTAFLEELGLSDMLDRGVPILRVPYRDDSGAEAAVRLRTGLEKAASDDRFRWEAGSKPLLYGLWRLRPDASVVIVEGESDCHTLWHHGINAVGLPGAGMWNERRDAHHLAGFNTIYVVVEPDHGGENMLRWIGKSSIRDRVRIVRLDSFKDPSEMHIAGPEQFPARWDAALAASTPLEAPARSTPSEPPRPLRRDPGPADPFPVGALGEILSAAARGIQEKVQAPIAICAQSVLAAATLAVQARADIQLPTGQARPIAGYFITVAGSGERKTSADREALWPIYRHEQNLREQHEAELPGYLNARDAWEKQRVQILGDKKRYPDPAAKRAALDELGPGPVGPLHPMLVCPEPTFEGLERLFAVGQPSMGVFSGEGGQFVGGHGMQKEAKLRTAAALSSLWDGDAIRRVRALDGATLLPGRRLSLHLMVEPDVANLLLCDRLLADQGLLSRLLVTAPATAAGKRLWREAPAEADAAIRR